MKRRMTLPRVILLMSAFTVVSACATVASIIYPLNENADQARAGAYALDDDHASILFSLNHFGFSEFKGRFDGIAGSLDLDADTPQNSVFTVEIDIASLHTGVQKLDDELFASNMFDVENHPKARFTSGTITRTSDDEAVIEGVLTIKGTSQPVTLDARFIGSGKNPLSGRQTIGFSATGTIKRSDFGLNDWLPFVSDEVALEIDVEFAEKR